MTTDRILWTCGHVTFDTIDWFDSDGEERFPTTECVLCAAGLPGGITPAEHIAQLKAQSDARWAEIQERDRLRAQGSPVSHAPQ